MAEKEVTKPWGKYVVVEKTDNFWIKKLFVNEGHKISLQSHKGRSEVWVVLKGKIKATKGDSTTVMSPGETIRIKKQEKHRIEGLKDSIVLEVAFGILDEEDITRFEDEYGREGN